MGRQQDIDRDAWRLLPSESVLWTGAPEPVPRERQWVLLPVFLFAFAAITALFAALMHIAEMQGMHQGIGVAALLAAAGVGAVLAPTYLFGELRYLVTDRRVLVRRGRSVRSMERRGLTYSRIRWHASVPIVGHLELVVAVPFGPLARQLRLTLRDLREPDRVLAIVRGTEAGEHAGDLSTPLVDRLEVDEKVHWGGNPEGLSVGWRELVTALVGVAILLFSLYYAQRNIGILVELEAGGIVPKSWPWVMLFSAAFISFVCLVSIGAGMFWWGVMRSRRLGQDTEYMLTERRLLIRRGRTELSVERHRIVDVAIQGAPRGLHHLFLVLDAPHSRALAMSGALRPVLPSRDGVPPVLFEIEDPAYLRKLLLGELEADDFDPAK